MVQELEFQYLCKVVNLIAKIVSILKHMILIKEKNLTINKIIELSNKDYIKGLSILGGEPMHPKNIEGTLKLTKLFKEKYPDKNIWVWTGYIFDKDLKHHEILNYIDVLIDGRYIDELHNPNLEYKGSSNQRVIDVKKSLQQNKIILYERELQLS